MASAVERVGSLVCRALSAWICYSRFVWNKLRIDRRVEYSTETRGSPKTFFVNRNYPNPFNPETTIRYGVPKQAHVKLTVYNIIGQKVATLVNIDQPAGYYRVKWDAHGDLGHPVPSGLYIYRFEAGNYVVTKKMTLMK